MSHDDVDSSGIGCFAIDVFPGSLFRGIEAVFVEVVHEGVVSEFGRVR